MSAAQYDVAQVCLNGHMVNSSWRSSPEFSKDFCPKCGTKTVNACPSCQTHIQGYCHVPGVISVSKTHVRQYCHACGKPYPWTSARIDAAKALAQELEGLSDADKLLLQSSIDDLVADSPMTSVAVVRFKKVIAKAGRQAADGFRDILVNVLSEAVRKQLWG